MKYLGWMPVILLIALTIGIMWYSDKQSDEKGSAKRSKQEKTVDSVYSVLSHKYPSAIRTDTMDRDLMYHTLDYQLMMEEMEMVMTSMVLWNIKKTKSGYEATLSAEIKGMQRVFVHMTELPEGYTIGDSFLPNGYGVIKLDSVILSQEGNEQFTGQLLEWIPEN